MVPCTQVPLLLGVQNSNERRWQQRFQRYDRAPALSLHTSLSMSLSLSLCGQISDRPAGKLSWQCMDQEETPPNVELFFFFFWRAKTLLTVALIKLYTTAPLLYSKMVTSAFPLLSPSSRGPDFCRFNCFLQKFRGLTWVGSSSRIFFLQLDCPTGISPMGNSGCYPRGKPAATESRYPTYGACCVFLCFHNPPNADMDNGIFNVRTGLNACDRTRGVYRHRIESALKADDGRKIPCRIRESDLR